MKIRKHMVVILCLLLMCTLSSPISSFAYSETPLIVDTNVGKVITKTEIIYVEDDEGNTVPVEITEIICSDSNYSTKDLSPTATVGEKRYYNVKVSNGAMGLASYTGKALSAAAKRKAGKIVANAIAKKLGSHIIPGISIATWVIDGILVYTIYQGKNGIATNVTMQYSKTYMQKEGYYIYGWSPKSISIKTY